MECRMEKRNMRWNTGKKPKYKFLFLFILRQITKNQMQNILLVDMIRAPEIQAAHWPVSEAGFLILANSFDCIFMYFWAKIEFFKE